MENAAKKLGATLQTVGKAMTISMTLPILAMGAASIKAASDLEETRNKVRVVFGDMSDDMLEWGDNAALVFGQSKQQALEAAGTFGNLFTSMGLGKKESADMSKGLVELAADLASFNNIDPTIVLEKLRSGLVGEIEPLRTLGINLTMAEVKAKALQMGLASTVTDMDKVNEAMFKVEEAERKLAKARSKGDIDKIVTAEHNLEKARKAVAEAMKGENAEIDNASLLQARYALILEQSTNAQGDFSRTSGGLANQMRILNAQWKDALATLGVHLLPIALKVIQMLNSMLEKFNNLSPGMQKAIVIILALVAVVGPLLFVLGAIVPMLGHVTRAINPFSGGIFGLVGNFVKLVGIAAVVVKVLGAFGIATGPVGAGILAMNAAILGTAASIWAVLWPILLLVGAAALVYWAFKTNFMGITTTLQQAAFIVDVWVNNTKAAFNKWVDDTAMAFSKFVDNGKTAFSTFLDTVKDRFSKISTFFKNLGTTASQLWFVIKSVFIGGISAAIDWVVAKIDKLKAALASIKLPAALNPGSPTPFEMGLRGIASAMDELSKKSFPNLQTSMAYAANSNDMARAMARPMQNNNSSSTSTVMNFSNGLTLRDVDELMDQKINRFVRRVTGGK